MTKFLIKSEIDEKIMKWRNFLENTIESLSENDDNDEISDKFQTVNSWKINENFEFRLMNSKYDYHDEISNILLIMWYDFVST